MFAEYRCSRSAALVIALMVASCGGGSPPGPAQPTPVPPTPPPAAVTVTSVVVGVAGAAPAVLAPGDKLQLFAQATSSDGTTTDATNIATWQSSNPVVATVSSGGVLTAFAEGELDVSATYQNRSGSLRAQIEKPGCRATLSPASLSFGALSSSATVTVTTTMSDCRWTAKSTASWLSVSFDPGRSGSGQFFYSVPGNNNPDPRDADIVVSVAGGPAAVHKIHQERPVGCVYRVSPEKLTFGASGGPGSFTVTTIPNDCQWRILDTWSSLDIIGPTAATGSTTVRYTVAPNASVFDRTLRVQGLSGLNPPAVHTVSIIR
jgi:hypothetical protein